MTSGAWPWASGVTGVRHRGALPRSRELVALPVLGAAVAAAIVCMPQIPGGSGGNRKPAASADRKPAGDEGGEAFPRRLVHGAVAPRGAILRRPQLPLLETRPVMETERAMRAPRLLAAKLAGAFHRSALTGERKGTSCGCQLPLSLRVPGAPGGGSSVAADTGGRAHSSTGTKLPGASRTASWSASTSSPRLKV